MHPQFVHPTPLLPLPIAFAEFVGGSWGYNHPLPSTCHAGKVIRVRKVGSRLVWASQTSSTGRLLRQAIGQNSEEPWLFEWELLPHQGKEGGEESTEICSTWPTSYRHWARSPFRSEPALGHVPSRLQAPVCSSDDAPNSRSELQAWSSHSVSPHPGRLPGSCSPWSRSSKSLRRPDSNCMNICFHNG